MYHNGVTNNNLFSNLDYLLIPDSEVENSTNNQITVIEKSENLIIWGSNQEGALNIPNVFNTQSNFVKSGENVFKKISLGFNHVVAQYSNNYLVGWGDNSYGQNNFSRGYTMTDFDAGINTNYFVDSRGRIHGLGQDLLFSDVSLYTGQIINPQIFVDRGVGEGGLPQPLYKYALNIKSVKAGSGYVIAVTNNGKITGWGMFAIPPEESIITGYLGENLNNQEALTFNGTLNSGSYVTINLTGSWSGYKVIWTQSSDGSTFSGLNLYNNNVPYFSGASFDDDGQGPAIYNGYLNKNTDRLQVILTGNGNTPATSGSGFLGVEILGYLGKDWQQKSMVIDHSAFSRINSIGKVKDIAAGYSHALALFENGVITGWGDNLLEQLSFSTSRLSGIMSGVKISTKVNDNLFLGAAYPIITDIKTTGLINSDPTGWRIDYKDNRLGVTGIIVETSLDQISWYQSQLQLVSKTVSGDAINFDASGYYVRLISFSGSEPVTGSFSIFNPDANLFEKQSDYKLYNEYKPFLQNTWTKKDLWKNSLGKSNFNFISGRKFIVRSLPEAAEEFSYEALQHGLISGQLNTMLGIVSGIFLVVDSTAAGSPFAIVHPENSQEKMAGNPVEVVITDLGTTIKLDNSALTDRNLSQILFNRDGSKQMLCRKIDVLRSEDFGTDWFYNGVFWGDRAAFTFSSSPVSPSGYRSSLSPNGDTWNVFFNSENLVSAPPSNINFGLSLYNLNVNSDFEFPSLYLGPISMAADELQTGVDYPPVTSSEDFDVWAYPRLHFPAGSPRMGGATFFASGLGEEVRPVGTVSGQLNTMSGIMSGEFADFEYRKFLYPDNDGSAADFYTQAGVIGAENGVAVLITGLGSPDDIRKWIAVNNYKSNPFTFEFKSSHSSDLYTVLIGSSGENDSATYTVDPLGINTTLSSSGRLWLFPNWNSGIYSGYFEESPMLNTPLVKSLRYRYRFPYSTCERSVCPTYPQEFYERTATIKSDIFITGNNTGKYYWKSAKITDNKNVYGIVENNAIGKNLASISFTSGFYINNSAIFGLENIPNAFSGNVLQIYSNNKNWVELDISEDGKYQTAIANTSNSGYIYITSDSGNNWKEVGLYSGLFKKVKVSSNGKYQMILNQTGNLKDVYSSNDYGNSWIPNRFYDDWIDIAVADNGLQAVINFQDLYYNYFKDYNENFKKIKDSQILDISAGYNSNLVVTKNKISYEEGENFDVIDLEDGNEFDELIDRSPVVIKDSWFSNSNSLYYLSKMYNKKPSYLAPSGEFTFDFISGRKFLVRSLLGAAVEFSYEALENGKISGQLNTMSGITSGAFLVYVPGGDPIAIVHPDNSESEMGYPIEVLITGLGTFVVATGITSANNFIKWYQNRWNVYYDYNKLIYYSSENTFYPWQVNAWSGLTTGVTGTFAEFNPGYALKTGFTGGNFGTITKYIEPSIFDTVVCNEIIFDEVDYCPGLGNYPWISTSLTTVETEITNPGGAPFIGVPNSFTSIIGPGISKTFYTGQFVSTGSPFNQTVSLSMGYNLFPPYNQLYSGFQKIITGWTGTNTFAPHCIKLDSGSFVKIIRSGNFRLGGVQWFSSNKNPNELSSDEKLYWSGSLKSFNLLGGDLSTGGTPINIFASQASFENTVFSGIGYLPERDNFLYISGENIDGSAFLTISGNKGYYNIINCS